MRQQPRRGITSRDVARLRIVGGVSVEEALQRLVGTGLAHRPVCLELSCPRRDAIVAVHRHRRSDRLTTSRTGQRPGNVALAQVAPERRVDGVGAAGAGSDLEGLDEDIGRKTSGNHARLLRAGLGGGVDLPFGRRVAPVPEHRGRPGPFHLAEQRRKRGAGRRPQLDPDPGEVLGQCPQRAVQPPAGGSADGAQRGVRLVDVDRAHLAALLEGRRQGGIVRDPEVVAEPDEARWGHEMFFRPRGQQALAILWKSSAANQPLQGRRKSANATCSSPWPPRPNPCETWDSGRILRLLP